MVIKKALKRTAIVLLGLVLLVAASFFTIRRLDNKLADAPALFARQKSVQPLLLSSLFVDGARFYLKLRTANGDTALAFGDSGGGTCMVSPDVIDTLRLSPFIHKGLLKGLMPMSYMLFRQLIPDQQVPQPAILNSPLLRRPFARLTDPFLLVPPVDDELKTIMRVMPFDLFLGQNFFMGKAWTIDYPQRQIWVNTPLHADMAGVLPIGFRRNARQQVQYGHASMQISVDGQIIDVLFDTGASIILSDDGKRQLHTAEKTIAGSFIAKTIFNAWRSRHPDWPVYPKADGRNDIIEVPKIRVGGYEAGPVLFAAREDAVWSEGMIHTMDKVVKGAIGGSALKYFKVTIDYNAALIKLER